METIKELAKEYVYKNFFQDTIWKQETIDAFTAGFYSAQRWISVCNGRVLHNQDVLLKLKNKQGKQIIVIAQFDGIMWVFESSKNFLGYHPFAWRPIERM